MADENKINTHNLISYILENQIAYQYCDEPIGFTFVKDSDVTPMQIVNEIKGRHCFIFDVETSEEMQGYYDLCAWSKSSDLLIKVDSGLLMCIPYSDCLTEGILKK